MILLRLQLQIVSTFATVEVFVESSCKLEVHFRIPNVVASFSYA